MFEFPLHLASPFPWWLVLAAAGGAGALTWRGYRRRTGEVPAAGMRVLKGLRLAAWALLVVCLLQPFHRSVTRENRASRLTVLVDDSESMTFSDRPGGASRTERVRAWLGSGWSGGGYLERFANLFSVQLESFADGSHQISELEELKGAGDRTDLAKALEGALARLKGPDAGGLILLSDGADTAKGDYLRVARRFRQAGVPIYALGIGVPEVPDLSIVQVRCRRNVSKDTLVRVEVEVARDGLPPGRRTVRILRAGKTVKESAVELKERTATAIFEFLPAEQGFLEYEAVIEPFEGELATANNRFAFGLVAFSRRLRVLYMEGSQFQHQTYGRSVWRYKWEHEFIVDALEEDADVDVDVLFKDYHSEYQGPIKTVKEAYPRTKKDLYRYDVVINSDIPIRHFNEEQVRATVDFVALHGGGFVMIGGYDAFGAGGYAKSPFDRMLPVEMNKDDQPAKDLDILWRVTPEGYEHPIMKIDPDPGKNRKIWEKLNTLGGRFGEAGPAFHGFSRTTRAKPAASVLALVDEENESYLGASVLVAVQPFGRGRAMAFTTDSTGGWGAEWEDSWGDDPNDPDRRNIYFKTFWKNAIRWLAHYRMQAPNQLVQIETDRLVYGRGEVPNARVKVLTPDYEFTHDAQVKLVLRNPKGRVTEVNVFPRYEEPGVYERKLELAEVGRYELTAQGFLRGELLGEDKTILQVRPSSLELKRLSQDVEALKKIAEASGGAYLSFDNGGELLELLRQDTHIFERHHDLDLWDNWWFFTLLIGLLCGEWYLRKKHGLP